MKCFRVFAVVVGLTLSLSVSAAQNWASGGTEACMDNGQVLSVDNQKAIQLRSQQQSGYSTRLLISGVVDEVFPDHSGHRHFSVKIGPNPNDHIEVIFNLSVGSLPVPTVGETAEACGVYIVSTSQNGGFPPSPDGMIIHWVHRGGGGHDPGFVILNGQFYN